jgi:hypothetical protein
MDAHRLDLSTAAVSTKNAQHCAWLGRASTNVKDKRRKPWKPGTSPLFKSEIRSFGGNCAGFSPTACCLDRIGRRTDRTCCLLASGATIGRPLSLKLTFPRLDFIMARRSGHILGASA